jgi:NADH dehydrogenase [ubiquinone] 1 alpha subcomplex assembly factor 5
VAELFDMRLRSLRRDRAARSGPALFLLDRAFDDCLDRISLVQRQFDHALLVGCPDPEWPQRLEAFSRRVDVFDPGAIFAREAAGEPIVEDAWEPEQGKYDLVLALGTLDTVNDLPRALTALRCSMKPQGLLLGAFSGGETLPRLRAAMREADLVSGAASPHVHPRIEASALAPLLGNSGFVNPVVDIDRVAVSYRRFADLVRDLRLMGATNILVQRPRTRSSKRGLAAAAESFAAGGNGERTTEMFEIIHFAAWSPGPSPTKSE